MQWLFAIVYIDFSGQCLYLKHITHQKDTCKDACSNGDQGNSPTYALKKLGIILHINCITI